MNSSHTYANLFGLLTCIFTTLTLVTNAQSAGDDREKYDLFSDGKGTGGLIRGDNLYVRNAAQTTPDSLIFDNPIFTKGIALAYNGEEVPIKARYVREQGLVQVEQLREIYMLNGIIYPYVDIDDKVYQYVELPVTKAGKAMYARLIVGTDKTQHAVVRTFSIGQASHTPPNRGISSTPPSRIRIDSATYLVGVRDIPIKFPKREKKLAHALTPCGVKALAKSASSGKYMTAAHLRAFVSELDALCTEN